MIEYPYESMLYIKFIVAWVSFALVRFMFNSAQPQISLQNCNHFSIIFEVLLRFPFHKARKHLFLKVLYFQWIAYYRKNCVFLMSHSWQ